jgi:hypothetical protein
MMNKEFQRQQQDLNCSDVCFHFRQIFDDYRPIIVLSLSIAFGETQH